MSEARSQSPHTPPAPRPIVTSDDDIAEDAIEAITSTSQDIFPTPHPKEKLSSAPMKRFEPKRAASTPPEVTMETKIRSIRRGTPGDLPSASSLQLSRDYRQLSKKRSQYFSDAFAYREPKNTPKDRVSRDSVVIAELKLSGTLDGDTSLVSDFSFHLAQTYQRPESCIMLTVQDSTMLLFGGSYEPAYLLSITALATDIAPTKNKRVTALAQDFLRESLNIVAQRGVVRFTAIAEEDLGTNGMTTLGEIEELERSKQSELKLLRTTSRDPVRLGKKGTTSTRFDRTKIALPMTPPRSKGDSDDTGTAHATMTTAERKRMKRRRSFLAFFGKGT